MWAVHGSLSIPPRPLSSAPAGLQSVHQSGTPSAGLESRLRSPCSPAPSNTLRLQLLVQALLGSLADLLADYSERIPSLYFAFQQLIWLSNMKKCKFPVGMALIFFPFFSKTNQMRTFRIS